MRAVAPFVGLACLVAAAQETAPAERGSVPVSIVSPGELVVPPREGDAGAALEIFLRAHEAHKRGDEDAALAGYLAFSGIEARRDLPLRYEATVRRRLEALLARIHLRYAEACRLYEQDRHRGLEALRELSERYPALPQGDAARALWQSDALHQAMADARALEAGGDRERAAAGLESAIRRLPAALYRYGAKSLLIRLGGPDLFEPGERVAEQSEGSGEEKKPAPPEDEGETTIEMDG